MNNEFGANLTNMTNPKATIGVCVRNSESSILGVIDSIKAQDFPHEHTEVIFVDDGSEDHTLDLVMRGVAGLDMHTKVLHNNWRGTGATRNTVVKNASGEYIVWVDGDMILPSDHVRVQVGFMEEHADAGIAKARYGWLHQANLLATLENIGHLVYFLRDLHGLECTGKPINKLPGTGGSIYRLEAIKQIGGFNEEIKGAGEDTDAARRIKACGWFIYLTSAIFYELGKKNLKELWDQYFWYGYGVHLLYHTDSRIIPAYKMVPLAGFGEGLFYSSLAYRVSSRKSVFLLPLLYAFKRTAQCIGFSKSHLESYGHIGSRQGKQTGCNRRYRSRDVRTLS
jgi:glycosyltransferase involved in cell wall biosynthesis